MRSRTLAAVALVCCIPSFAHAATGRLTVRVTDVDTGKAIPARLVLRAADGSYPGDRVAQSANEWPNLDAHAVFIAGEHTFELPPGQTSVTAAHGFEYHTDSAKVDVPAGGEATVRLQLKRFIDLRRLGWVCGDAHLHMIHGEMQRPTSYDDVALTCNANGLDWAFVNQEYVGAGERDLAGLHAECAKVSTDDFRLMLGGERPKSLLGHNALIGVTDPFVIPDDPPYHEAARVIHAQGGVSFFVHPTRYFPGRKYLGKWLDFPGNNLARELVFDAYCGPSFDGLSVLSDEPNDRKAHQLWFNLLNRGFFVPALADSDACFDRPTLSFHAPGFWATYLNVGPEGKVDGPSLAGAVRRGQTFATTGPLVLFTVDGQMSGATLPPDGKKREVRIEAYHPRHAWTLAESSVAKVELIRNGQVVKTWEPKTPEAKLTWTVEEADPCWYAARVYGADGNWQVAVASPVYFAEKPAAPKREPMAVTVRGRIYDFKSGGEIAGESTVEVRRGGELLKRFKARGQFRLRMPLDARVVVGPDDPDSAISQDLLLGYGPVHRFLWNLQSEDLADPHTLDTFEELVDEVTLEFPLGHRMAGCYFLKDPGDDDLKTDAAIEQIRVLEGPPNPGGGSTAVAAVLLDKGRVRVGDTINVAAVFRYEGDEGTDAPDMRLVIEGRAYDPSRPTGFNPLKVFGTIEQQWSKAVDAGHGYRYIKGTLKVPPWAAAGPVGAIDIGVRSRGAGGRDGCFIGMQIPLAGAGDSTRHALVLVSGWPTMPLSWPDHNYGVGPLKVCGKAGREANPKADYRKLRLSVKTNPGGEADRMPFEDCRGCDDADDAVFTDRFSDMVLHGESGLSKPDKVRQQEKVKWRDVPVVDATDGK